MNKKLAQYVDALDNGYTYRLLADDLIRSFNARLYVDFEAYKRPYMGHRKNLIKQEWHNHPWLKVYGDPSWSSYDYQTGTLVTIDFHGYVEPLASLTMEQLVDYVYSREMIDPDEWNPKRVAGIMNYCINEYGLELTLFMITAAYDERENKQEIISLDHFDRYLQTAKAYLSSVKANIAEGGGGENYVPRKRNVLLA